MNPPSIQEPIRLSTEGHNGVPINVWDFGGSGPNLVLCHCTGTLARVWDPVVQLLQEDFRILAPDTRGHGDSGKPEDLDAYAWSNIGSDLKLMTEQLKLGSDTFAAGHSAGGTQVAYCQFHHPRTFARAVLIDPIIGPAELFQTPSFLGNGARKRRREFPTKSDALANFSSKPPMNAWVPEAIQAYVEHGLDDTKNDVAQLKCPPEVEGTIYDRGGAPEMFERLDELSFERIAHVTANNSNVKGIIEMQREGLVPDEYIVIQDASHFIPQERPEEIADILRRTFA